jgi:hypothetical protein
VLSKIHSVQLEDRMWRLLLVFIISICTLAPVRAQYSQLQTKNKDSVKKEYPYIFPFLGKKAVAKGFNIPLPAGVMINTFFGNSEITINNLQLGFEGVNADVPLTPIEFIQFGKNTAQIKKFPLQRLWHLMQ